MLYSIPSIIVYLYISVNGPCLVALYAHQFESLTCSCAYLVVCPFRNIFFMDRIYQILKVRSLESVGVSVGLIILNLKIWFFVLFEVTSVLQPSEIQP